MTFETGIYLFIIIGCFLWINHRDNKRLDADWKRIEKKRKGGKQ